MSDLNIRITHRTEIEGRAVERTIDIETISPLAIEPAPARANALSAAVMGSTSQAHPMQSERYKKVIAPGTVSADPDRAHVSVIDTHTGLQWLVESIGDQDGDPMSHADCEIAVAKLDTLGHTDWRLPTRTELAGLIDDTRHEPAIDTDLFPRVKPRWHWTSTPCAWSSASAWVVDFYGGYVYSYRRYYSGFALAVRRVGQ